MVVFEVTYGRLDENTNQFNLSYRKLYKTEADAIVESDDIVKTYGGTNIVQGLEDTITVRQTTFTTEGGDHMRVVVEVALVR